MQEIGIESDILEQVLSGQKTIEVRLGTPKYIKLRKGDELSLREDIWENGKIINAIHGRGHIKITQLLYFESFEELFGAVSYKLVAPSAASKAEVLSLLKQFYSAEDEYEYGAVAITFELI